MQTCHSRRWAISLCLFFSSLSIILSAEPVGVRGRKSAKQIKRISKRSRLLRPDEIHEEIPHARETNVFYHSSRASIPKPVTSEFGKAGKGGKAGNTKKGDCTKVEKDLALSNNTGKGKGKGGTDKAAEDAGCEELPEELLEYYPTSAPGKGKGGKTGKQVSYYPTTYPGTGAGSTPYPSPRPSTSGGLAPPAPSGQDPSSLPTISPALGLPANPGTPSPTFSAGQGTNPGTPSNGPTATPDGSPSGQHNSPAPTPTASPGSGQNPGEPSTSSSDPTPVSTTLPTFSSGLGNGTPVPTLGEGNDTPGPTPSTGEGNNMPTSTPVSGTPAPTTPVDQGGDTPIPTSFGLSTPTSSPGQDNGSREPTRSPDSGSGSPAPTTYPGQGGGTPEPTMSTGPGVTASPTLSPEGNSDTPAPSTDLSPPPSPSFSPGSNSSLTSSPSESPEPTPTSGPADSTTQGPDTSAFVDCEAIANGAAPTNAESVRLLVEMNLTIQSGVDFEAVAGELKNALQMHVATRLAGCSARRGRFLQEEKGEIVGAVFESPERVSSSTCSSDGGTAECIETSTGVQIYYTGTNTDGLEDALTAAVTGARNDGLLNVPGLLDINGIQSSVDDTSGGVTGAQSQGPAGDDDDGFGAFGIAIVSASAAAVAMVALLFFVARRKRKSSEVSHISLPDDGSFSKEIGGDSDTDASSFYRARRDEDSIASAWIGPQASTREALDQSNLGKILSTHDVRTCNSSLCEICEQHRKTDPTFISTETPSPPPRLPNDAVREYLAEDTVEL